MIGDMMGQSRQQRRGSDGPAASDVGKAPLAGLDASARRAALERVDVSDRRLQPIFERVMAIACQALSASAAMVTLVDDARQWSVACAGTDVGHVPLDTSFCVHAIADDDVFVVPDTTQDARFANNPFVAGPPHVRFYAGAPLSVGDGLRLGTLCVLDFAHRQDVGPRHDFDDDERALLASLASLTSDLLDLRVERRELVRARDRMEDFSHAALDLFWETDAEHRYTYISAENLGGLQGERYDGAALARTMIGKTRWDGVNADIRAEPWRSHVATMNAHRPFRDFRYRKPLPGGLAHFSISGRPVFGHDGTFLGYRGAAHNVTAEEAAKAREIELANTDPLTDLPNRRRWQQRLDRAVRLATEDDVGAALIVVDLDHFKEINDSLGHAVGDGLLKEIALRLRESLRVEDFAARLGGDEFAILLHGVREPEDARKAACRLLAALRRPVMIDKHLVQPGATLGIALLPRDGRDADALMVSADLALYRAKAEGRGRYAFFEPKLRHAVERRADVAHQLRRAIDAGEFEMHYQPQIMVRSGAISGVEALLRWRHPERGLLTPIDFLDVLETLVFNLEVGRWIIDDTCRQAAAWAALGTPVRVGINISPGQMQAGDLPETVERALHRHGLPASLLEIEITERVILRQDGESVAALQRLRAQGVSVAFDDFGTGFASLATLRDCLFDRVKIDRAFIADVMEGGREASIAKGLLAMCRGLGLPVTAEGVEERGQDVFLRVEGCEEAQGYHYGRPMPADDMTGVLERGPLEVHAPRTVDGEETGAVWPALSSSAA